MVDATKAELRQLLDDYLRMYASRDDRLTAFFSEDFSGFTGGGDFLVKDTKKWIAITRQDFAQVKDAIRIELKDVAIQSLTETIAVATSFFAIHLPMKDHVLSRKTARLVLIFRHESAGWKITHSSISIPYELVRDGEVYPLQELMTRNQLLEELVSERTIQLSQANEQLREINERLADEIAERRQAVEALRQSEDRYRSILNASPDDITITDINGYIIMVSPAARSMFGWRSDEDFGKLLVTDFLVEEDRPRALAKVAEKLRGISTGPGEYRARHRDGHILDIEVNSEFIRDESGAPTGMVVIVRDITQRKQVEAEKERLEAQNRQLQKAESLSRMAGAIAHHFNNQLQSVMMRIEMALEDWPSVAGPAENLSGALESARKAAEMSSLMLTYLGQTSATRVRLDLSATCKRSLGMLRAAMPKQMALVADLPEPGPVIQADPNQIQRVLTNLVTNAWEATDGAADVRLVVKLVAAADIPATHRFPVGWQPQGRAHACLEVTDAGCGIAAQDIEKIFDPFFSSKFPGRGMGLAVVLGIVRALDGAVTVTSQPGRGSIFRIFLPVTSLAGM